MELDELKKRLQALKDDDTGGQPPVADGGAEPPTGMPPTGEAVPPVAPPDMPPAVGGAGEGAAAPYLTMDNFGKDFGQWYGNDAALGEILFDQMRAMGVDTRAATEAALRNVLADIVNRSRMIMQQLSYFVSTFMQQTNQMAAMGAAVNNALAMTGSPIPEVNVGNPPPAEPDMGAMGGAGELPPPPPAAGGEDNLPPPPEGGAAGGDNPPPPPAEGGADNPPPPSEGGAGDNPPPPPAEGGEGGGELPPPPPEKGTPSDKTVKNIESPKYVVSDAQAKDIYRGLHNAAAARKRNDTRKNTILDVVSMGY